eukprot:Gb_04122 [translate_table: standard]
MEGGGRNELDGFLSTGIYQIPNANALFVDPVRILNSSYNNFSISPALYYSRSLPCLPKFESQDKEDQKTKKRQRKRKRNAYVPNEKEQLAEKRHWLTAGKLRRECKNRAENAIDRVGILPAMDVNGLIVGSKQSETSESIFESRSRQPALKTSTNGIQAGSEIVPKRSNGDNLDNLVVMSQWTKDFSTILFRKLLYLLQKSTCLLRKSFYLVANRMLIAMRCLP